MAKFLNTSATNYFLEELIKAEKGSGTFSREERGQV